MSSLISLAVAMIVMMFSEAILSVYFNEHFDVSENLVGYYFSISCITLAVGSPIVGALAEHLDGRYLNSIGFLLCSISLVFFGPSYLLGIKDSLVTVCIGLGLLGFSVAFLFVP